MYPNDCKNADNKCSSKVNYLNNMNSIWPPDWMQSIATIKMPELVKIPAKVAQKADGENRATIRKLTRDVLSVLNSSELVQKKQVFDHAKSELEELVSKPQVSTKVQGPVQKLVSSVSQEIPSSKQSEKGSKLSSALLDPNDIFTQLEPGKEKDLCLNKDRYKTELCRKFMENSSCPYGKKCQFAHGYHELRPVNRHPRYRTELCREFFIHGLCTYGTRCNFIHRVDSTETQESDSAIKFLASSSQQQQQQLSTQKSQSLADLNSSLSPDDSGLSINAASNSTRPYTPDSESSVDLFLTSSSSSSSSSSSTRLNETMTSAVLRKPMQPMQGLDVTTHF